MHERRFSQLGTMLLLLVVAGCDAADPLGSELALAFRRTDSPSGTSLVVVAYNQINVSWQDNSPNETGFEVHRAPGAAGTFALIATTTAGVTSYADGGLSGATEYCYKVRALRTTGKNTTYSDFSNASCGTTLPVPVPAAPSEANAVPSYSTLIALSWRDNSTDESGFRVEFSLDAGTSWQSIGWDPPANATSINHSGRTPDQSVCYRVMAFNGYGNSLPSNMDCTAPPLAPAPLTANGVSGPAIDLSWPDLSAVEDGYEVRRAGPDGQWSTVVRLAAGSQSYHDVGIAAGIRYSYTVAATRDGGYSDFSSASAMSVSAPPPAPTAISAVPQNSSYIAVSWAGPTDNVERFRIERSTDGGTSWSAAGTADWYYQSFWDGVLSEQRTCYRVIAVNSAGESASGVACSTAPLFATDLSATPVNGGIIDLSWTDNSSVEDGYEVWQVVNSCGYYYYCYPYYSLLEVLPANATSFRHSGLDPNTFYSYVVVARKDGGYSNLSIEVGSYPGPIVP
jgi:fibronectin type III domain protein